MFTGRGAERDSCGAQTVLGPIHLLSLDTHSSLCNHGGWRKNAFVFANQDHVDGNIGNRTVALGRFGGTAGLGSRVVLGRGGVGVGEGGGLGLYHFEGAPVCGAVVCVQVYILLLVSFGW